MKTVLCMLNSKFVHSSLAPWCLFAGIKKYCGNAVEARVVEGTVNEDLRAVAERIIAEEPDVIGFCCYIWNIASVKKLAQTLKDEIGAVIVFGGPEVSYNAGDVLNDCRFVDYVLSGEGEEPFARLCSYLAGETGNDEIPGLCYRTEHGNVIVEPYISGKEPVSPYCDEYFASLGGRIAYIEASRGCPFSCAFCLSGRCGKLVFYNIERVKEEILRLAATQTQTVKFIDRTFNANTERANAIITFIMENYNAGTIRKGVCFHFEVDGGTLKESTLQLLENAPSGLFQLEVGLQSFNPQTLKAVNCNPDTGKLVKNIQRLLRPGNLHIHVDLIAGLPHEDLESFEKSFNKLYALRPHMLQLGFLKLLHGSELREKDESFGCVYSEEPPYEVRRTDCLSEDDLQTIHHAEAALDRLYNSGRFSRTLDYLTEECGFSPFALFRDFGAFMQGKEALPLDEYLTFVYNFFAPKTNKAVLRDRMICDRLASNASGVLPDCLKIPDKRLKQIKKTIHETLCPGGGKIACAILYTENRVVWCDYKQKDDVTGQYTLTYRNGVDFSL